MHTFKHASFSKAVASLMLATALSLPQSCTAYDAPGGNLGFALLSLDFSQTRPIQSGQLLLSDQVSRIRIHPVNMEMSFSICSATTPHTTHDHLVSCELTNSNELTIRTSAPAGQIVNWQIVEFQYGAHIQRGRRSMPPGDLQARLTHDPVNFRTSFPLLSVQTFGASRNNDEQRLLKCQLLDATTTLVERQESGIPLDFYWQIVSIDTSSVTSGNFVMNGADQVLEQVQPAPSSSFVLFSTAADGTIDGVERQYMTRGRLNSDGSLAFRRESALGSLQIAWSTIQFPGLRSFTGTTTFSAAVDTEISVSVPKINAAKAVCLITTSSLSTAGEDNHLDAAAASCNIISDTQLLIQRQSPDGQNVMIDWQLIEFP